jgi:peptidoglycan/LPS O-acetylase OafA/YrhL
MNHVNMRLALAKVPYSQGLPGQLVKSLFWNGQYGVQMFFAVSGFLITSITLRRWHSLTHVSLRGFYRLRFARIGPLLVVLLGVLSVLHLAHVHNFVVPAKTGGLGRALLAALTFHVNLLEARRGYLPGNWDILWSLSVEEMFYLFFPLVCRLLGQGKLLVSLLFVFVVAGPFGRTLLAHGNETWREYSYLGSMDAIALGCLTALLVSRVRLSRPVLRGVGAAGAAVLVFILGFSFQAYRWGLDRSGLDMTILAVGTCMFIAASAQAQWKFPRLLAPLLKIGEYSYEIYLTHMFVVFVLFDVFVRAGKPMWLVAALFMAVTLLSSVVGALVASFYSEPMNRRLRSGLANQPGRLDVQAAAASESESTVSIP